MISLLSPAELDALRLYGDESTLRDLVDLDECEYYNFVPRRDDPENHDQQTAFVDSNAKFAICLGGTGSGKTIAAAYRTARFLLNTPPPRPRCPFWVIGETYDLVCGVCWVEKLSNFIPKREVLDIDWIKQSRRWPRAVMLRHPDKPKEPGWMIEFKSFEQGREHLQSASIGGFWLNEATPGDIVEEVIGRTREYGLRGWADFTPVEMRDPYWFEKYQKPERGWKFYHLNTRKNQYLAEGWADDYLRLIPDELRPTREWGAFSEMRGMVYKEYREDLHVIPSFPNNMVPREWRKVRAIDFGCAAPFCCLWLARDREGRWYVYDEHYRVETLNKDHAAAIKARPWAIGGAFHALWGPTYSDHDPQQRRELAALGIPTTLAKKEPIVGGISLIRSLLMPDKSGRPRLYVCEHCENTRREFRKYRWPEGTDTRNPKEEPLDVDNHAMDALRYGVYTDTMQTNSVPEPLRIPWKERASIQYRRARA